MMTYLISLTILTASVILLRALFRKNISACLTYAIWLAVVLRLCLPFDLIQVDMTNRSIGNIEEYITEELSKPLEDFGFNVSSDTPIVQENVSPQQNQTVTPTLPQTNQQVNTQNNTHDSQNQSFDADNKVSIPSDSTVTDTDEEVIGNEAISADAEEDIKISLAHILGTLWVAGSIVTLTVFGVSYLVFSIKLRRSREYYGMAGKTKIYVSERVFSPCVSGIIPKIYITPDAARSESLSVILLHEKTHLAHGDHLWNMLRVAAVIVHWWNPFVWAAAVLSKRDAELACDESVAKRLDSRDQVEYARMIVDMTPVKKNYAVGFASGPIKERVLRLTSKHRNKIIAAILSIVLVVSCVAVTFVGAKDDDNTVSSDDGMETVPETESETDPDTVEPEVVGCLSISFPSDELLEDRTKYDSVMLMSVGGDVRDGVNVDYMLTASETIHDLQVLILTWSDGKLLKEEVMYNSELFTSEKPLVISTVDYGNVVECTGISYTDTDGNTVRYYLDMSSEDGSPILVPIEYTDLHGDMIYVGLPRYAVAYEDADSLGMELEKLNQNGEFVNSPNKVLVVHGLSTPVYIELGEGTDMISAWAYGYWSAAPTMSESTNLHGNINTQLYEYNGAVILSRDYYEVGDTWIFTPYGITEFHPRDDSETSVTFGLKDDGTLGYTRFAVRFNADIHQMYAAPLELAVSRDEFLRETGSVSIGTDGAVTLTPSNTYTISDVYDLDQIYEENKDTEQFIRKYPNCYSADDVLEMNKNDRAKNAIFEEFSDYLPLLDMTVAQITEQYGELQRINQDVYPEYVLYSLDSFPEIVLMFICTAENNYELTPEMTAYDIRVTEKFTSDVEGLNLNADIETLPVGLIWDSAGYNGDNYNAVVSTEVYGYELSIYTTLAPEKLSDEDFMGNMEIYERVMDSFRKAPFGTVHEIRLKKSLDDLDTSHEISVDSEHIQKAETDIRYKWIVSFIGKDIDTCADILASEFGASPKEEYVASMSPLADISFASYSVTDIEEDSSVGYDSLKFEFEIQQSSYELYPEGKYTAIIAKGGLLNFSLDYEEKPRLLAQEEIDKYTDELEFARNFFMWGMNMDYPADPYGDQFSWRMMTENLFVVYSRAKDISYTEMRITKDDLLEIAREVYGIENYALHEDGYYESDGYCYMPGHGGIGINYEIIGISDDNGTLAFDIRYYSDCAEFGNGGVVRYVFERMDSPYGMKLSAIEKIVSSGNSIYYYVV